MQLLGMIASVSQPIEYAIQLSATSFPLIVIAYSINVNGFSLLLYHAVITIVPPYIVYIVYMY